MDKVWAPFKRQEDFLSLPDTIKEALYGGAAMGGKSDALLMLPLVRGFYKHPRFKGIIFRRTFPELERELWNRSEYWFPPTGAKPNRDKHEWRFPSGAIYRFGHVEYDSDARKYDTDEYHYMAFDELTSFSEFQYTYLAMSRCRSSIKDLPAIVRSGTNPGNIGHGWVRKRFIECAPYGSIIVDKASGLKRIFIPSRVDDNPHAPPDYKAQLLHLPLAERRAKLDGDWWTFSGQVFDDWREERFADEPSFAQHVIEPFPIPQWWPRILAVDWGFAAMTVALWGAISPDNRLYIYREYAVKQTKISTWATDIGRLSADEKLADIVMCQSAFKNRGEEEFLAQQFENCSGLRPRPADNARIAGKLAVQEFLRWREKPKAKIPRTDYSEQKAQQILRIHGLRAYQDYLLQFQDEAPEENLPKLQIFTTCKELRRAIPLCIYDEDNKEDVKEFDGDDPYDAVKYLCLAAERYMNQAPLEGDSRKKVDEIIAELERTGDQNRFYRRMESIERSDSGRIKPVKLHHSGRVA